MILALTAVLAIVAQDHTPLRAAPRASAAELTSLWQGDVVEVRGERAGYLKVYSYRHERGGYLRGERVRRVELTEAAAPELLAVLRFLRDSPGSEALGISYGAAYLKAVAPRALAAEPLDAIARMAERLADSASAHAGRTEVAAHLEVVEQFGIHMKGFERNGRVQICYDGELYRRVLGMPRALPQERAQAALALTRSDCVDPDLGPAQRALLDEERRRYLDAINETGLDSLTRSRIRAQRASLWAALTYSTARRGAPASAVAQRALAELVTVQAEDFGEDQRGEYLDALLRVSASRWGATLTAATSGPLTVRTSPGAPGQTCVALLRAQPQAEPLIQRCTYGVVWPASAQAIAEGRALVLAVQPLESWRELWLFRLRDGVWSVDVLSPGTAEPEAGYIDFAGFAPGTRRLLLVRELRDGGRFHRSFEERRLDDLALVRQASTPELLRDFGRWQDVSWRRDTLSLR